MFVRIPTGLKNKSAELDKKAHIPNWTRFNYLINSETVVPIHNITYQNLKGLTGSDDIMDNG